MCSSMNGLKTSFHLQHTFMKGGSTTGFHGAFPPTFLGCLQERVARDEEQLRQLQQESLALKAAAKQRLRQQGKKVSWRAGT